MEWEGSKVGICSGRREAMQPPSPRRRRWCDNAATGAPARLTRRRPAEAAGRRAGRVPIWQALSRRDVGQHDAEGGALARLALDVDAPAVRLRHVFDDGEAEAGAALFARAAAVDAVEALEDPRQRLRRDADAGVAHLDHQRLA